MAEKAEDPMTELGKIKLPPTWGQVSDAPGAPPGKPCILIPV